MKLTLEDEEVEQYFALVEENKELINQLGETQFKLMEALQLLSQYRESISDTESETDETK